MSSSKTAKKEAKRATEATQAEAPASDKLSGKDYEREMARLHVELVKLQQWVVHKKLKVLIIFEGRDGAGKGGTVKAITERVSPRIFRVVALPAPTEREKSQLHIQRYVPHLPAAGEIVIFDRSWCNRAGVERVMGFCTDQQAEAFLNAVPSMERTIVNSGIVLVKVLARGQREGADAPDGGTHPRRPQDLEAVADGSGIVQPLVRLCACPRRHVQSQRHPLGALVSGPLRRQKACPTEHNHAPAEADPLPGPAAGED